MAITLLKDLATYEVSFVPKGANKKKRFLVVKENGEIDMDKLLEMILKEGLKDEEQVSKVAKSLGLDEDGEKALKAVMKLCGEGSPLSAEKLGKALKEMGVDMGDAPAKEEPPKSTEKEETTPPAPDNETPVNKEDNTKKGGSMPTKVPIQKEDGSWDLSGVDESIRQVLEVVCKSNEKLAKSLTTQKDENKSLAEKLAAETNARVLKEFEERAKEYGHVGDDAKELAKVLKAAHDADPENGKAVEAILKAANEKIEAGKVFEEVGTSGTTGGSAWQKIEKSAEKMREDKPELTTEAAIDLVMKHNPKLVEEHYAEEKGRVM
jgi:hypothetical protein